MLRQPRQRQGIAFYCVTMADDGLIDLLRKYEVPVDQSSLKSVLQDEEQGRLLSEWAKSHLVADTLLTKNELNS